MELSKLKFKKFICEEIKALREYRLSSGAYKRMDGLVKTSIKRKFGASAIDMFGDLEEDGFERDEIIAFFHKILDKII